MGWCRCRSGGRHRGPQVALSATCRAQEMGAFVTNPTGWGPRSMRDPMLLTSHAPAKWSMIGSETRHDTYDHRYERCRRPVCDISCACDRGRPWRRRWFPWRWLRIQRRVRIPWWVWLRISRWIRLLLRRLWLVGNRRGARPWAGGDRRRPVTTILLRQSIMHLRQRIISRHHRPTVRRRPAAVSLVTLAYMCARWIVRSRPVQAAIARATTVREWLVGPADQRLLPIAVAAISSPIGRSDELLWRTAKPLRHDSKPDNSPTRDDRAYCV